MLTSAEELGDVVTMLATKIRAFDFEGINPIMW